MKLIAIVVVLATAACAHAGNWQMREAGYEQELRRNVIVEVTVNGQRALWSGWRDDSGTHLQVIAPVCPEAAIVDSGAFIPDGDSR